MEHPRLKVRSDPLLGCGVGVGRYLWFLQEVMGCGMQKMSSQRKPDAIIKEGRREAGQLRSADIFSSWMTQNHGISFKRQLKGQILSEDCLDLHKRICRFLLCVPMLWIVSTCGAYHFNPPKPSHRQYTHQGQKCTPIHQWNPSSSHRAWHILRTQLKKKKKRLHWMWYHQLKIIGITALRFLLIYHSIFIWKSRASWVTNCGDLSEVPFKSHSQISSANYM